MASRECASALFMPLSQQDCTQVSQNTALPSGLHQCLPRTRDPSLWPRASLLCASSPHAGKWVMKDNDELGSGRSSRRHLISHPFGCVLIEPTTRGRCGCPDDRFVGSCLPGAHTSACKLVALQHCRSVGTRRDAGYFAQKTLSSQSPRRIGIRRPLRRGGN